MWSLQPRERNSPSQGFLGILLMSLALSFSCSSSADVCGKPPAFENMDTQGQPKSYYDAGEKVHYECKQGYKRQPSATNFIICAVNGSWSSLSKHTCSKTSCDAQVDPENGQVIVVNGSFEKGTQVKFVCDDSFSLTGNDTLYCQLRESNLQWSGNPPQCVKILCSPPPKIENGKYIPMDKEVFEYFEVVTYSCNSNPGKDAFSLIGEKRLFCFSPGKWTSDPPQCKVVICPHPVLENGRLIKGFKNKYYYKSIIVLECIEGFMLNGSNTFICDSDNTWKPPNPKCLKGQHPPTNVRPTKPSPSRKTTPNKGPLDCEDSEKWIFSLIVIIVLAAQ